MKACRQLGRETIAAFVIEVDDLRAELMLIDENLYRNEFSPAERAAAVARRKVIYEEIHPGTKHGGDRRSSPQVEDLNAAPRFTKATAEATGRSEQSIQRDAARGRSLSGGALTKVVRTSLDKGDELDALIKLAKAGRIVIDNRLRSHFRARIEGDGTDADRSLNEHRLASRPAPDEGFCRDRCCV